MKALEPIRGSLSIFFSFINPFPFRGSLPYLLVDRLSTHLPKPASVIGAWVRVHSTAGLAMWSGVVTGRNQHLRGEGV